jgi:exosortase A-associated hydrolase 1
LLRQVGAVSEVVIWGLCDAASAAALFANRNPAVSGIVMLNPWVRDDATIARTYLRHYYPNRLVSPSLWGKVLAGRFEFRRSLKALFETTIAAARRSNSGSGKSDEHLHEASGNKPLQERMVQGLQRFSGRILIILSGQDLTAREFIDVSSEVGEWRRLLEDERVTRHLLPDADHTFRVRSDLDRVAQYSSEWIRAS